MVLLTLIWGDPVLMLMPLRKVVRALRPSHRLLLLGNRPRKAGLTPLPLLAHAHRVTVPQAQISRASGSQQWARTIRRWVLLDWQRGFNMNVNSLSEV